MLQTWCVTRAFNPVDKHPERITKLLREQSERLDWGDMKFLVKLKEVGGFENLNSLISVNVFGYKEQTIYPLRISKLKR